MNPLRVALFTDSDVFAGTERHMLDLALGLREEGVEVQLACPVPSALADRAAAVGLPVIPIPRGGPLGGAASGILAGLLKSGALDLLHAHNGRTALFAAVAVRRAARGCSVFTQHFLQPAHASRRGARAALSRWAHRWVNRSTGAFIAISEAVRAGMLARGQGPAGRITVVPNGMPSPDMVQMCPAGSIRAELGIAPDAPLIVSVARLVPEKSLDTLVAAMAIVAATAPLAVCVIAGEGKERDALQAQIARAGLEERVKLVGFRRDPAALMHAGDIFVLPSIAEPFGLVIIEAMAVGRPVVAIRAGGPVEIVEHGETGYLVSPGAIDELGNAILSLLSDVQLRRRMGMAGHARFEKMYTVERMARATIEVYERAVSR